ncbi:MAG: MarR family transcriptional regulator [Propionibacteriaceae bacterium]|jgi:DNA-binding MarR family transcriptional regulator|nr:MarR family transcriptional regulator [Propionibacteriaceae bacterium]
MEQTGDVARTTTPTRRLTDALLGFLRVARSFADSDPARLSWVQFDILARLGQQADTTLTALAESLGYDLSVLSRQAALLVDRGLVVRVRDAHDGRAWRFSATAAGRARFEQSRERRTAWLATALAPFSDAERETAANVLVAITTQVRHRTGPGRSTERTA